MIINEQIEFLFSVALGYLRLFDSKLVNAWSSGTGMAGLLGSGYTSSLVIN